MARQPRYRRLRKLVAESGSFGNALPKPGMSGTRHLMVGPTYRQGSCPLN